jgi:putative transposase
MLINRGKLTISTQRSKTLLLIKGYIQQDIKLADACELANISVRTYQRWLSSTDQIDKRTTAIHIPANKLSEQERNAVIAVSNSKEYASLPPSQIVPSLADKGIYIASESTFYRILKSTNQLEHRRSSKPNSKRYKPKECIASAPNQVYTWDITYLPSLVKGVFLYLYMMVDIYSRKIVGWQVHDCENSKYASQLLIHVCQQEGITSKQITLHSDNGSPMKGATMLYTMQQLGVIPSYSRPSVSNDNPYSESLFKTVKHCPGYSGRFTGLTEARDWTHKFVTWYNYEHKHSGISFVSPDERHKGQDKALLNKRKSVYEHAMQHNPHRWVQKKIRCWEHTTNVYLNPDNGSHKKAA